MRWFSLILVIVCVWTVCPITPAAGQDDGLIDDFEHGGFADRWWFYTDDSPFSCAFESPGYNSERALTLHFDNAADQWPGCAMSIENPAAWANAEGLHFVWRSDPPGRPILVALSQTDPTQTNPEAEGSTPFQIMLEVPGEWSETFIPWSEFAKAEWVGETGITALDLTLPTDLIFATNAGYSGTVWIDDLRLAGGSISGPPPDIDYTSGKMALWTNGTLLRGINIWQRLVVPEIDGGEFLGSGPVGPPYTLEDFGQIVNMGANLVVLSVPGLYTETPPYQLDEAVQTNLDTLLALAAEADLFVVISFRTGPGRSDFTFYDDDFAAWGGDPALVRDNVWTDQAAQDAWVEMWEYAAGRYRGNPVVAGYDLMVEPNAAGRLLDIWDGADFYPAYANTLYDWNQFYPRLVAGIRRQDQDTPIIVGAMGWSAVAWLPYLRVIDDPRIVYAVHQYEPQDQYTHQEPGGTNTYPGEFDADWDGRPELVDRVWLDHYLSIIDAFREQYHVPVVVTEYGLMRWVPNAADFMRDQMRLFEARGLNHAFWAWNALWPPHNELNDAFDITHGPDPDNHTTVESDLLHVVLDDWSQNIVRPSNFGE